MPEALSIEAQLGLGPEGPNPTGRGVEAVPALARGHMGLGPQGPNQAWEDVAVDYQDSSLRRDDTVHREPTII